METLLNFIAERERIRCRKEAGEPWPWTEDRILQTWSFTNIRREDDRVTRWITDNWREPNANDPDLWFAMAVARYVNWPDSLAALGYPFPWNREFFITALLRRAARIETVWGPAYNIPNAGKSTPKAQHIADVLDNLWQARNTLRPKADEGLAAYHARLAQKYCVGSFYAGQIIADLKFVEPLKSATDWWTFAPSGPGSRRGLNRFLGRQVNANWAEWSWRREFRILHESIAPELGRIGIGNLAGHNLQNCLCEFDKYMRVKSGEGKPKRRYVPRGSRSGPQPPLSQASIFDFLEPQPAE